MTSRRFFGIAGFALAFGLTACGSSGNTALPPTTTTASNTTRPVASTVFTPTTSAAATTRPPTTVPATTVPPLNLRSVNWLATLRGINLFSVDTTTVDASDKRPFVKLTSVPSVAGYALLDSIDYGDISGDGVEEALVTVFSGGTAGNTGLLVFDVGVSGKVELAGPIDFYKTFGYKTGGTIHNNALTITNVVGAGWEPNCCQSGLVSRTFKLVNGVLAQQGQATEEGVAEIRSLTITHFYELINAKRLDEAYTSLSPSYQAANPIAAWKAGFATTKSVVATSDPTAVNGPVKFHLDTVDTTATGDLKRTYTGTWSLLYSVPKHQWLLDKADIQLGG
jgi:hypothetical protein